MRLSFLSAMMAMLGYSLGATTLQQLTVDDMITQSTAVVHVKVSSSSAILRGRNIYTVYQLQVMETLKAGPAALTQVAVPGGSNGSIRQDVAGAPVLEPGGEYVIFLWTSRSGLTQVIGLSQGLFNVRRDATGNAVLVRASLMGATVVGPSGRAQNAPAVTITLAGLNAEIQKVLGTVK